MKKIIIYGKGSFAKLMHYYFNNESRYEVIAFCVDDKFLDEKQFCGLPVVSLKNIEKIYSVDNYLIFVAVGYSNMRARKTMYNKVKSLGYSCPNYIHQSSDISDNVELGENNAIFKNVMIEPFVSIGDNNIIWSSSTICHDVTIDDHSFIASQVLIGGNSHLGNNCFLGFNSTILQNLFIMQESLIAAKALVKTNTQECTKYVGIPAVNVGTHHDEGIKI